MDTFSNLKMINLIEKVIDGDLWWTPSWVFPFAWCPVQKHYFSSNVPEKVHEKTLKSLSCFLVFLAEQCTSLVDISDIFEYYQLEMSKRTPRGSHCFFGVRDQNPISENYYVRHEANQILLVMILPNLFAH